MSAELERALRSVEIDWPGTPDIASAVRSRLAEQPAPRRLPSRRRVAAIVLALLLGAGAAVEPARSALLEFFGLKSVRIERRPVAPTQPRSGIDDLDLGRRMSMAEAHRRAGFKPAPPTALGAPAAVFFDDDPPEGGRVSYVYPPRPGIPESEFTGVGLLITEFVAVAEPFIEKSAGPGTELTRFRIDGDRAFFISGDPHGFAYREPGGGDADVLFEEQRLAGNTLLVEHEGLLLRIEGQISRKRAVEIARSITATSELRSG